MIRFIVLNCCAYEVATNTKNYEYLDCFASSNFFKKKMKDGRAVKKELILMSVCPQCGHRVLKFLWYGSITDKFDLWQDEKIIRGKQADEIFARRQKDYTLIALPNPFKPKPQTKQSKKLPWVYGKVINGETQQPQYIDETEAAGRKIKTIARIVK